MNRHHVHPKLLEHIETLERWDCWPFLEPKYDLSLLLLEIVPFIFFMGPLLEREMLSWLGMRSVHVVHYLEKLSLSVAGVCGEGIDCKVNVFYAKLRDQVHKELRFDRVKSVFARRQNKEDRFFGSKVGKIHACIC